MRIVSRKVRPFLIWLFVLFGAFVRMQELGYANLQGDEINPLDYVYEENFIYYLLNQKRGPIQYLINFANTSLFGYINEFQVRLPYLIFALAGFVTLYLLAKKIFDKKTALYSLVLMSINGLFVAFSRIAQYQSFLFFALPFAGYFFIRHFERRSKQKTNPNPPRADQILNPKQILSTNPPRADKILNDHKHLIASALIYSLCLLAHYDALSMAPFFALFITSRFLKDRRELRKLIKDSAIFLSITLIPNLLFYSAMRFNPYYEDVTKTYLSNRLLRGGLMPRLPDIMPIISLYIPKHYLLVLLVLLTIGLIGLIRKVTELKIWKFKLSSQLVKSGYIFLCLLLAGATVFSYYPIKPRASSLLVVGAAIGITIILLLSKKVKPVIVSLVGWILFPYCIYFFIIRDPRTHVYTTFLPGFVLAGYGVKQLMDGKIFNFQSAQGGPIFKHLRSAFRLALFIAFVAPLTFESGVIWQMFVDKNPEHPWWNKEFLGWPIYEISRDQYDKPEGVFGVSYYRGWERFGEGIKKGCLKGSFYSNEKDSISYWYSRVHQVAEEKADNLVLIEGPHSWVFMDTEKEREGYTLIKTIESKHGLAVMRIWGKKEIYPESKPYCEF